MGFQNISPWVPLVPAWARRSQGRAVACPPSDPRRRSRGGQGGHSRALWRSVWPLPGHSSAAGCSSVVSARRPLWSPCRRCCSPSNYMCCQGQGHELFRTSNWLSWARHICFFIFTTPMHIVFIKRAKMLYIYSVSVS